MQIVLVGINLRDDLPKQRNKGRRDKRVNKHDKAVYMLYTKDAPQQIGRKRNRSHVN